MIFRWRGLEEYNISFHAMREFTKYRTKDTIDEIWFVEHFPVFTIGQKGDIRDLLKLNTKIQVIKSDRGGNITYHGPGQIVAYILIDLYRYNLKIREFVNLIEQVIIDTLLVYNLSVERKLGAPGVYISSNTIHKSYIGAKIASIGLKICRGCSYHGVSLNVNMNLNPFSLINPCGYFGLKIVDMATFGIYANWNDVANTLSKKFILNLN